MFGLRLGAMGRVGAGLTLTQQAINVLRKPGLESHVYMPGVGWVNGLSLTNTIMEDGTQAASVDNPLGYMGDPIATVGPELVTNSGPFTTSSGSNADQAGNITNDASYRLTYTASGAGVGNIILYANGKAAVHLVQAGTNTVVVTATTVTATAADTIRVSGLSAGTISNISVKELVGAIPARQATTANKPILRRGAVNRALFSQQFDNVAWSIAAAVVAPDQTTAPDGTLTADRLTVTGASQSIYNSVGIAVQPGMTYTQSVRFKLGTMTEAQYRHAFYNNTATTFIAQDVVPTITDLGDGWKLAVSSVVVPAGCTSLRFYPYRNTAVVNGTVFLWGAQLETGSTASPYIPTTTAAASSPTGPYWWEFDGTDFLSLASVPFGLNDDFVVVAGASNEQNVTNNRVFAATGTTAVFRINWDAAISKFACVFTNDAAASIALASPAPTIALGQISVVSVRQSGSAKVLRTNAVAGTVNSSAVGVGTLTSAGIGSQGGAVIWRGGIYPVIAIKGTVNDADLAILERYVAAASGVTLP